MSKKKRLVAGLATTHRRNDEKLEEPKPIQELLKQPFAFKLQTPEAIETGSLHKRNLTASAAENNLSQIPNEDNPATGYLPTRDGNEPGGTETKIPPTEEETDLPVPGTQEANAEDGDGENEEQEQEHQQEASLLEDDVEGIAILDVDGVEDSGIDDVVFAEDGDTLMALRAHRVIATLSRKRALKANIEDLFLSEEFEAAVHSELAKLGLRAGLKAMGFQLAKVNFSGDSAIRARVQASVSKQTEALAVSKQNLTASFTQSLALAAVGGARRYFKQFENPLRDGLVAALSNAGVRGAERLVAGCFHQHSLQYAHNLVAMASELNEMSQEQRDLFAEALDMVDDTGGEAAIEVDVGNSDFADMEASEEEDDFLPENLVARLSNPGRLVASKQSGPQEVSTGEFLRSDAMLF